MISEERQHSSDLLGQIEILQNRWHSWKELFQIVPMSGTRLYNLNNVPFESFSDPFKLWIDGEKAAGRFHDMFESLKRVVSGILGESHDLTLRNIDKYCIG